MQIKRIAFFVTSALLTAMLLTMLVNMAGAQPRHGGLHSKIPRALWGEYCFTGQHTYVPRVLDMGRQCMPVDYLAVTSEWLMFHEEQCRLEHAHRADNASGPYDFVGVFRCHTPGSEPMIIENIEYRFGKDKRGKLFVVLVERTRLQ